MYTKMLQEKTPKGVCGVCGIEVYIHYSLYFSVYLKSCYNSKLKTSHGPEDLIGIVFAFMS